MGDWNMPRNNSYCMCWWF